MSGARRKDCQKCDGEWAEVRYEPPSGKRSEGLRYTCQTCGYSWRTLTKDRVRESLRKDRVRESLST